MEVKQDSKCIRRQEYKPYPWHVRKTNLHIHIFSDFARVSVTLDITPNTQAPASKIIDLCGEDLELDSVKIDGVLCPSDRVSVTSSQLRISDIVGPATLCITSRCNPYNNTALEGLYLSGGMLCTQCEPEGFRRICYFPDRPDVMSVFTVKIEASKTFPHLLSNGNLLEKGDIDADRHYALWHDPHKKPCYLFALVVGALEYVEDYFITASGREVILRIYVEKGQTHLTNHALASLKRAMRWDEQVYGLEYDLDLFQIVAVSHFNMGAMENKGLNIFNSSCVLADAHTATDDDLLRIESIVAHEYFHNWTGNRVTCRDWFQLTLKEGLTVFRDQCFTEDMHEATVKRIEDVARLRAIQFSEDASPTAHPIRPESYIEINNFYTPTVYEKGAEIIRMLQTMFGQAGFQKGMRLYFDRHDGQAITCDDFIAAMADANHVDLSQFSLWYAQAGTPEVTVRRIPHCDDMLVLDISQNLQPNAANTPTQPMVLPLRFGFVEMSGKPVQFQVDDSDFLDEHMVCLSSSHQQIQIRFSDQQAKSAIPSFLRGFSAPIRVHNDVTDAEQTVLATHDVDKFNRYESCQILAHKVLQALIQGTNSEALEDALVQAMHHILQDNSLRHDFKAMCLTIPGQAETEQHNHPADPSLIWQARYNLQARLGKKVTMLADIIKNTDYVVDAPGRSLLNRAVYMSVAAGQALGIDRAFKLSQQKNMTLIMGGLHALNHLDDTLRQKALSHFYKRFSSTPLIMEKWLMLSATSSVHGTIESLDVLMRDSVYDRDNPNNIRAVLGAFISANPTQFHNIDGSAYLYIADNIAEIDKRNPQIAARLALGLTRFSHYVQSRQTKMRKALTILSQQTLSPDLYEVVHKALTHNKDTNL